MKRMIGLALSFCFVVALLAMQTGCPSEKPKTTTPPAKEKGTEPAKEKKS